MPTPFAALEARINAAVMSHLANATADLGGGVTVDGMFDAEYQDALGVSAARPAFQADAGRLSGLVPGAALSISCSVLGLVAVPYVVAELHAEHGLTLVWLRRVS